MHSQDGGEQVVALPVEQAHCPSGLDEQESDALAKSLDCYVYVAGEAVQVQISVVPKEHPLAVAEAVAPGNVALSAVHYRPSHP